MKLFVRVTTFFLTISSIAFAQTPSHIFDPEMDYVHTSEDIKAEYGLLKGDEILRLDLDLYNNGHTTIFLTFNRAGSKSGSVWTAYFQNDDHSYRRIDGIQFREDFFRAGKVPDYNPDGGLLLLYPGKGVGILGRYRFLNGQANFEEIQHLDYSKTKDQQIFESIFKRKWNVPFPDFFSSPPHQLVQVKNVLTRSGTVEETAMPNMPDASLPNAASSPDSVNHTSLLTQKRLSQVVLWVAVTTLVLAGFWIYKRKSKKNPN